MAELIRASLAGDKLATDRILTRAVEAVSIRKSGDGARLWSFSDAETALAG